jgi:hypothetical protein
MATFRNEPQPRKDELRAGKYELQSGSVGSVNGHQQAARRRYRWRFWAPLAPLIRDPAGEDLCCVRKRPHANEIEHFGRSAT